MERELTTEQLTLIEAYLMGKLNAADQALFDQYMREDPLFLEEFTFQSELKKALRHKENTDFKKLLDQIESNYDKPSSSWSLWWGVAAAILILSTIFISIQYRSTTYDEDLVSAYFEPQTNIHYPITRNSQDPDLRSQAFLAYESMNWEKAGTLFDSLSRVDPSIELDLYQANLLILKTNYDQAIPLLERYKNSTDPYSERAFWYLALSHLGSGNTDKAIEYLNRIIETKSHPYDMAVELRDELSQP